MSHTGNYGPGLYWWKLTFLSKFVINKIIVYPGTGNSLKGIEALIDGQSLEVISSDASLPFTINTNGKIGMSDSVYSIPTAPALRMIISDHMRRSICLSA